VLLRDSDPLRPAAAPSAVSPGRLPAAGSRSWRRDLERTVRRHRRLVAAGLAALAVLLGLAALAPPAAPTTSIVVAARDLPAGRVIAAGDLTTAAVPAPLTVAALTDPQTALGRVLAAPLAAGSVVPAGVVAGPEALASQLRAAGRSDVAVPVRLGDAGAAALLQPGDVVDVWATETSSLTSGSALDGAGDAVTSAADGLARRVAASVTVLAVPRPARDGGLLAGSDPAAATGGLVVLAVPSSSVAGLAHAAAVARLAATVLPR